MTKMIIYTKGTVKIVENPSIVEKFQLTEESAIEGFYCTYFLVFIYFKDPQWYFVIPSSMCKGVLG